MVKKGAIVLSSLALAGGLVLVLTRKAQAAHDWCCPYADGLCFSTYAELAAHVQSTHPGERIPLPIEWE